MRESQLQLAAKSGPVLVPLKRKTNRSHTQECPGSDFNGSTRSSLGFTIKQASENGHMCVHVHGTCIYVYTQLCMEIYNYIYILMLYMYIYISYFQISLLGTRSDKLGRVC